MDIVDNDTAQIDFWQNRQFNWGPAGYDRKYVFNANYVYMLPSPKSGGVAKAVLGGWEDHRHHALLERLPPHRHFQRQPGHARRHHARGLHRRLYRRQRQRERHPALVQSAGLRPPARRHARATPAAAFCAGPGINNWDFSLFKNTNITEHVRTQLRIESFNLFNHTQFSGVNTGISGSAPGAPITSGSQGCQRPGDRDSRSTHHPARSEAILLASADEPDPSDCPPGVCLLAVLSWRPTRSKSSSTGPRERYRPASTPPPSRGSSKC